MSVPLGWVMKLWDQFCYVAASCSATLGSITWQEVSFSWQDLDAVIESGMLEKTIDVFTTHAGVGTVLHKSKGLCCLFISDGEEHPWVLL